MALLVFGLSAGKAAQPLARAADPMPTLPDHTLIILATDYESQPFTCIYFADGSAVFDDEDRVIANDIVDRMKRFDRNVGVIEGSATNLEEPDPVSRELLARARADALAAIVFEAGVDQRRFQITTNSVAFQPWRDVDAKHARELASVCIWAYWDSGWDPQ